MSMRLRELHPGRDWDKKPLKRAETQVSTPITDDNPLLVQQSHNDGDRLSTVAIAHRIMGGETITHTRDGSGRFIDAAHMHDFRDLMNDKVRADSSWLSLPKDLRKRFDNDPASFLRFCLDEANIDELRDMGLAQPLKVPEVVKPTEVIIVNPEAPRAEGGGSKGA